MKKKEAAPSHFTMSLEGSLPPSSYSLAHLMKSRKGPPVAGKKKAKEKKKKKEGEAGELDSLAMVKQHRGGSNNSR